MRQLPSLFNIVVCAMIILPLWSAAGYGRTDETIFQWTAGQMGAPSDIPMPQIRWVTRVEIKQVFINNNRKAYLRWETEYGEDRAQAILKVYLDEIVGLFDPPSNIVYVGSFLDACHRQAILAHEFTHYLQHTLRGKVPAGGHVEQLQRWKREVEAYAIEERYTLVFCEQAATQAAQGPSY